MRIHHKTVFVVVAGVLLTLGGAAPVRAQATNVVCTGCVASTDIADLGVASVDLAGSAVTSAKIANSAVTSAKIADDAIANADVSAAAAIAGTKIVPNFGSQNVITTGKAGIGTATPQSELHVHNPAYNWSILRLTNLGTGATGGDGLRIVMGNGITNDADIINGEGNLRLGSIWGPVMMLNSSGNVGIGTMSPTAKLHIAGGFFHVNNNAPTGFSVRHDAAPFPNVFRVGGLGNPNMTSNWDMATDKQYSASYPSWEISLRSNGSDEMRFQRWSPGQTVGPPVEFMRINALGNVGIGTTNPGVYKLAVKGKIHAEEVVVDTGWADFVFKKDYDLMPLEKVARHIEEAGHLPGIPTEQEVKENGVSIGQMQSKLLQKIEEMTLYVIELKKENETLKGRISSLEKRSR